MKEWPGDTACGEILFFDESCPLFPWMCYGTLQRDEEESMKDLEAENGQRPPFRGRTEDEPFFSFSHLSDWFQADISPDGPHTSPFGFASPREEALYETGILFKSFMKC